MSADAAAGRDEPGWRPPGLGALVGAGVAILAFGALFRLLPWLDLWASDLFFAKDGGFFWRDAALPVFLYTAVDWLQVAAILGLVALGAVWIWRRSPPFGLNPRAILLFAGTLAIGAGLLVNAVFKDHWDRARPAQIERYGGALAFSPPGVMARQCGRNCSFPAGHPALIFAGFGLALAMARARRRRAVIAVSALGGFVGLGRIVQGAHFLSDVIFAGLICYAVAAALALLLPWALARWPAGAGLGREQLTALASRIAAMVRAAGSSVVAAGRAVADAMRAAPLWAITLAAFALVALSVAALDQPLALWLKRFDATPVADFLRAITFLGRAPGWLALFGLAVIGLWLAERRAVGETRRARFVAWKWRAGWLFASVAAPSLASSVSKVALGRLRPRVFFYEGGYGFAPLSFGIDANSLPSGHATVASGLATGLALVWPRLWPLWLGFALVIAASRLAITVHYLGDVVAGLWLGSFTVLALALLSRRHGLDIVAVEFDARGWPRRTDSPRLESPTVR